MATKKTHKYSNSSNLSGRYAFKPSEMTTMNNSHDKLISLLNNSKKKWTIKKLAYAEYNFVQAFITQNEFKHETFTK